MPDDSRWAEVAACDKGADGRFYYGVRTTGVFCRPSCTARTPLRENVVFFDTPDQAISSGFRPCKRCRPDLPDYDPDRELVEKAKEIYAGNLDGPQRCIGQLGVSANHLMRLFKRYEGCTQGQYLARMRIEKAKQLLRESDAKILQIALGSGFESLSNFYKRFKEHAGVTPTRYRSSRVENGKTRHFQGKGTKQ